MSYLIEIEKLSYIYLYIWEHFKHGFSVNLNVSMSDTSKKLKGSGSHRLWLHYKGDFTCYIHIYIYTYIYIYICMYWTCKWLQVEVGHCNGCRWRGPTSTWTCKWLQVEVYVYIYIKIKGMGKHSSPALALCSIVFLRKNLIFFNH